MGITEEMRRALSGAAAMVPAYATVSNWIALSGMGRSVTYEMLAAGTLRAKKCGNRTLIDVPHGLAAIAAMPDFLKDATPRPKAAADPSQ